MVASFVDGEGERALMAPPMRARIIMRICKSKFSIAISCVNTLPCYENTIKDNTLSCIGHESYFWLGGSI